MSLQLTKYSNKCYKNYSRKLQFWQDKLMCPLHASHHAVCCSNIFYTYTTIMFKTLAKGEGNFLICNFRAY
jgi:hypothetical protein